MLILCFYSINAFKSTAGGAKIDKFHFRCTEKIPKTASSSTIQKGNIVDKISYIHPSMYLIYYYAYILFDFREGFHCSTIYSGLSCHLLPLGTPHSDLKTWNEKMHLAVTILADGAEHLWFSLKTIQQFCSVKHTKMYIVN